MDYFKIGKATELKGKDRVIYRVLEIIPGLFSWVTLLGLLILSYFYPVFVSYFIIAFDVYWLLLVIYLALHLIAAYKELKKNTKINWKEELIKLNSNTLEIGEQCLTKKGMTFKDITHLIVLPTYEEGLDVLRTCFDSLVKDGFDTKKMIVVLAIEERAGHGAVERANTMEKEYANIFKELLITIHPDNLEGEIKGKGANQAWAAKQVQRLIIDRDEMDYDKIIVSIFDIDTVVKPGYFSCLTHRFLTVDNPYRASYQPVPVYHNNVWQTPFFSRVAASSNTFWQMMMQIRQEKLVTYSSHSMTWKALVDIGFWSTNMVSEDSRIFFHCMLHYNGDYRVEPLHFPVSMDATKSKGILKTARNLYKQQRRWAWGVESVPYLAFNLIKRWKTTDRKKVLGHIFIQVYGFHSWATNALIVAVIGWMPMLLGGERFNSSVLSGNLPLITQNLMNLAMVGLVLSAIMSTLLLPKRPSNYSIWKNIMMIFEWIFIPITILFFGAIPCIEAQTRLMFGKYMGFWVTPKER